MVVSEAQKRATQKWNAKNYDRIYFFVPKGGKDIIKKAADENGESVNAYVEKAVLTRLKLKSWEKKD